MTPIEVAAALRALGQRVGLKAETFCSIDPRYSKPINIAVYAHGVCRDCTLRVDGDEFAEVIAKANALWDEMQDRFESSKIEEMALEIIRLTALHGVCTDAALRGNRFSSADLKQFGGRAIEKANAMAANGPFSIQQGAKANAA